MREIKQLKPGDIGAYTDIAFNAYPSFKDFRKDAMEEYGKTVAEIMSGDKGVTFYGMFEEDELIAVMRLFDFKMNLFGEILPASGIGFLGVHLMHKKKKAAKEMVEFYESVYKERGIPVASLLPFRPDFYRKLGYGAGTKMNSYRIETARLPAYFGRSDTRWVKREDFSKLLDCHAKVTAKTHGMIMKIGDEIRNLYEDEVSRVVASYDEGGNINGYIIFKFQNAKPGNYTANNIYVSELVYETPEVLRILLGFLRKQEDQVQLVIFNTHDEYFHYLFDNPLNDSRNYTPFGYIESNTQSIGMMYKILDAAEAFRQCSHRNYNNADLCARFVIQSAHAGEPPQDVTVKIEKGKLSIDKLSSPDITVKLGISDFSALFVGAASVKGLYGLGLISPEGDGFLEELDRAFYCSEKPVCYTDF